MSARRNKPSTPALDFRSLHGRSAQALEILDSAKPKTVGEFRALAKKHPLLALAWNRIVIMSLQIAAGRVPLLEQPASLAPRRRGAPRSSALELASSQVEFDEAEIAKLRELGYRNLLTSKEVIGRAAARHGVTDSALKDALKYRRRRRQDPPDAFACRAQQAE